MCNSSSEITGVFIGNLKIRVKRKITRIHKIYYFTDARIEFNVLKLLHRVYKYIGLWRPKQEKPHQLKNMQLASDCASF